MISTSWERTTQARLRIFRTAMTGWCQDAWTMALEGMCPMRRPIHGINMGGHRLWQRLSTRLSWSSACWARSQCMRMMIRTCWSRPAGPQDTARSSSLQRAAMRWSTSRRGLHIRILSGFFRYRVVILRMDLRRGGRFCSKSFLLSCWTWRTQNKKNCMRKWLQMRAGFINSIRRYGCGRIRLLGQSWRRRSKS